MKIGFVVNQISTEEPGYTTTRLAMAALNLGHEVWSMGAGDFAYDADENIRARARSVPKKSYKSSDTFLMDLQGKKAKVERITVDDLDILMLRSDPSIDIADVDKRPAACWNTRGIISFRNNNRVFPDNADGIQVGGARPSPKVKIL